MLVMRLALVASPLINAAPGVGASVYVLLLELALNAYISGRPATAQSGQLRIERPLNPRSFP